MAEIELQGLTKVFGDGTVAVDDLNLVVEDGEFLVLVGPSGSGKTTVLRMTAGLEDAAAGQILIGGEVVNDVAPMDRDIAMVFQNYALYPHMTVYANMAFGLKLHGMKKQEIRPRVEAAAQMLGISELLQRKPSQLSGGQRQRVAMGRAIVREPAAFLMDEPLSNLDAKLRVEMRAYVALLHQRLRTTTLYVTHDQIEAMTMGTRVAVMRAGRLEQCDTPAALYERPANMFVAAFIGSPSMNMLHSRLEADGDGLVAQLGSTRLPLPRQLVEDRPGLRAYAGRPVVLGIRPEDFEDAAFASGNGTVPLTVEVALAESTGADAIIHFPLDVEAVSQSGAVADALDVEDQDVQARSVLLEQDGDAGAIVSARVNPRTSARGGEKLALVLDPARLHVFDPDTEEAIR